MRKSTKAIRLVFIGVALFLVAIVYYNTNLVSPTIGAGPAGPVVPLEPFKRVWTDRPVLILGLGDSITTGYGASPEMSYFERMVRNPKDEFGDMAGRNLESVLPNLSVLNISVNGSTSLQHERLQIPEIMMQSEDTLGIVVMTTGGNDLIHMYGRIPPAEGAMYGATVAQAQPWIANFKVRLEGMLEDTHAQFPGGCHIFLANIYDPSDGEGTFAPVGLPEWDDGLAILVEYNKVIAACVERYDFVHLVDIYSEFLGHGLFSHKKNNPYYRPDDHHYWYYENLEDPNDRGYDAIRRVMLNKMSTVLATE